MEAVIEHWHLPPAVAQPLETNSDSVRDVDVIRSIPGVGRTLTVLFSEAAIAIEQRDHQARRTLSRVAPVTRRSGKKTVVRQRRAVNNLMQNALFHWAKIACMHDATR